MKWLRLYSEARNDAKLRSLTAEQFRVWFNLLCFASDAEERGVIAYDDLELVALETAAADVELLTSTLARLVKLQIVSHADGAITFLHWDARQYDNPSDRPEATRERQRRRRAASRAVADAAEDAAPSSIYVTAASRAVTSGHDTEQSRSEQSRSDHHQRAVNGTGPASAPPAGGPVEVPALWLTQYATVVGHPAADKELQALTLMAAEALPLDSIELGEALSEALATPNCRSPAGLARSILLRWRTEHPQIRPQWTETTPARPQQGAR